MLYDHEIAIQAVQVGILLFLVSRMVGFVEVLLVIVGLWLLVWCFYAFLCSIVVYLVTKVLQGNVKCSQHANAFFLPCNEAYGPVNQKRDSRNSQIGGLPLKNNAYFTF